MESRSLIGQSLGLKYRGGIGGNGGRSLYTRTGGGGSNGAGPRFSLLNMVGALTGMVSAAFLLSSETHLQSSQLLSPAIASKRVNSRPRRLSENVHYEYVIIGAGTAAYTALAAIRESKPEASVLMISEDQQMARLDIAYDPEHIATSLQDVYNEWRRHIACRLGSDEWAGIMGNSSGNVNVRKWTTRTGGEDQNSSSEEGQSNGAVSLLVESSDGVRVFPDDKSIVLSDGSTISYGQCLLATPGKPRELYVLKSTISYSLRDKINTLRDIRDFQDLYNEVEEGGKKILVIGGGYLGSTLAAALLDLNERIEKPNQIVQTFVESSLLQQYFPGYLCAHLVQSLKAKGLDVRPDHLVTGVTRKDPELDYHRGSNDEESSGAEVCVTLMQGPLKEYLEADYVILASTNVEPDVEIARRSQLELDEENGGVVVNSSLEAYDGLFVAGSASSYYDACLGRRRVDFYDNALNSGLLAGQNMVSEDGRLRQYTHQPTFRCTMPGTGLQFEAVGKIDSNLPTVGVWLSKRDEYSGKPLKETAYERGIVYYLKNNVVVGVLCCNASECLDVARDVLREGLSFEEASKRMMLAPPQWVNIYKTK